MRLLIIRHADPVLDGDGITPDGHREAQALAQALAGRRIDALYCSPLHRARETMKYTADALQLEAVIAPWLAELDWVIELAPWPCRSAWNLPGEVVRGDDEVSGAPDRVVTPEMRRQWNEVLHQADCFVHQHGYERVGRRYRPSGNNPRTIALFTHCGLGLTWLAHLLDLPLVPFWASFWLDPCSITTVHFERRSEQWAVPRCLCLGDTSHLLGISSVPHRSSIYRKFAT